MAAASPAADARTLAESFNRDHAGQGLSVGSTVTIGAWLGGGTTTVRVKLLLGVPPLPSD